MQRTLATIAAALIIFTHPLRAADIQTTTSPSEVTQAAPVVASENIEPAQPSHERLFIAIFDCRWNNASKGPSQPTTVQQIYQQLQKVEVRDPRFHPALVSTDCARDNWFASHDRGQSIIDARLSRMYGELSAKTLLWLQQDPRARISLLELGGSWGAVQAAEFSMEVDRRGIRIAMSPQTNAAIPAKVLVAPGQATQALAMLDPVGAAGREWSLPASVVSGIQFTALDEHRGEFKSAQIVGRGKSPDGRFLGLFVAGAHSDVCGGYHRNGLAIRTANLLITFINRLSETPLLEEQIEPVDPRLNVIHRSEEEGS